MKVMTVGLSPFLLASRSKLNSWILRYFYLTGHSVAGMVWGHNTNYFVPEEKEGIKKYYYDFEFGGDKHKIPLLPFEPNKEAVDVYEILNGYKPDLIVLVGEPSDFLYMHAVKSFYSHPLKVFAVLLTYNTPINEDHVQILEDLDGVLCTSAFSYEMIKNLYNGPISDMQYVGCNTDKYCLQERDPKGGFTIMSCAKVSQSDNAPMIMQAVSEVRDTIPSAKLYLHSNIYDPGDHDLNRLKDRFDPKNEFISFPEKYVSLLEGVSEEEMAVEFGKADVFLSIPMISATSMSIFQALACGCYPVMSDCGSNRNIAELLSMYLGRDFTKEDFLVPSIELMAAGETYLYTCDRENVKKKIVEAYRTLKKDEGLREGLSQFTRKYSQGNFLKKMSEMAMSVIKMNPTICLERI